MATTALTKTFGSASSASDRYKFTFSTWFKRGVSGSNDYLFGHQSSDGANDFAIRIDSDVLRLYDYQSSSYTLHKQTSRLFRDHSAWYHIVIKIDTTQSTASDRVKIYVNGTEETAFGTSVNPSQNQSIYASSNTGQPTVIGGRYTNSLAAGYYWDGSLTHTHCCIGYAYDASSFGETDTTSGIWKPKTAPSVTYGSNGFFLKFENSGAMGTDSSGNSNTFTVNGSLTQNVDTPSNNYATLNAVASNNSSSVLTNGNLTHTSTTSWVGEYSSLGANAGKWYAEGKITDRMNYSFGVIQNGGDSVANISTANNNLIGKYADGWGFAGNDGTTNNKRNNNTNTSYGEVFSDNDIFMICLDVTGGKIYFGRNGSWFNSSDPASGANPAFTGLTFTDSMHFASGMENGSLTWNFGQGYFGTTAVASANSDANGHGIFEYAVPSGFYALNTKNLKEFG